MQSLIHLASKRVGTRSAVQVSSYSGIKRSLSFYAPAIGIDLGTTKTCVAVTRYGYTKEDKEKDKIEIIPNTEGSRTTLSLLSFAHYSDTSPLIGSSALSHLSLHPLSTFNNIKKLIGLKFHDPIVEKLSKLVKYKIVANNNGDACVEAFGKIYHPSEILSFLLKEMKKIAENYLDKTVNDAVLTVPAYFNFLQRQEIQNAGSFAGLEILKIINEPVAACLAYNLLSPSISSNNLVAVFNLGGIFDFTILSVVDGNIEIKTTNGDVSIGGEDFDNTIVANLLSKIKEDYGVDLSNNIYAEIKLKEVAERAKIELSGTFNTEIMVPFIASNQNGPFHLNYKLSRAKFEQHTEHLVNNIIERCKESIKEGNINISDIKDVVMVGGMSRMPRIKEEIAKLFSKDTIIHNTLNPEEVVAIGAAVQASKTKERYSPIMSSPVVTLSLGIEKTKELFSIVVPRNTYLPTRKSVSFSVPSNQTTTIIKVFEGERIYTSCNHFLKQFCLELPPLNERETGDEREIEVTFDICINEVLNVVALDKATGREVKVNIPKYGVNALDKKEIEYMVQDGSDNQDRDMIVMLTAGKK